MVAASLSRAPRLAARRADAAARPARGAAAAPRAAARTDGAP
jgi:hypothetical protein